MGHQVVLVVVAMVVYLMERIIHYPTSLSKRGVFKPLSFICHMCDTRGHVDNHQSHRGYQAIHTHNRLFHLPDRWNLIRPLGQGAYGLVISVQDSLSGEPVAVKCITRVFDKVILARRALREITLLRHFGDHENLTGWVVRQWWDDWGRLMGAG